MKYEEVDEHLINTFHDLIVDEFSEGLPYCVADCFARYLLEAYKSDSVETLILAGMFIEELYSYKDAMIDNLATVGYLEAIQNVWGNNSVNPEEMVKFLRPTSKNWWARLNDFWKGDIHALTNNID